jgi:hypothetical protein
MRLRHQLVSPFMIAALCVAPIAMSACGGSRVYDPTYGDYHRWNGSENRLYLQWEGETRRNHTEFGLRPPQEQRAYFGWRHGRR